MTTPPSRTGGPVAIRGFLAQTLAALLDIAQRDASFSEITLEPQLGHEQFDFAWTDAQGVHAVQVKSTINEFTKSKVTEWAGKLEAVRQTQKCRLVLIGRCDSTLNDVSSIGKVTIDKRPPYDNGYFAQAAHQIACFLEGQGSDEGTSGEREVIADALVTRLLDYSTTGTLLSRDAFLALIRRWIKETPRQKPIVDMGRIDKYAPTHLIGRETETEQLDTAWN